MSIYLNHINKMAKERDSLIRVLENMETRHVVFTVNDEEFHPDWCRECRVEKLDTVNQGLHKALGETLKWVPAFLGKSILKTLVSGTMDSSEGADQESFEDS